MKRINNQAAAVTTVAQNIFISGQQVGGHALHLPPAIRVEYGGAYEEQQRSFRDLVFVLVLGGSLLTLAVLVATGQAAKEPGVHVGMYFFLATITLLAAAGDIRVLSRGGISGSSRLARHLWRMCFGWFIVTGSFFLGKQELFPAALRKQYLLLPLANPAAGDADLLAGAGSYDEEQDRCSDRVQGSGSVKSGAGRHYCQSSLTGCEHIHRHRVPTLLQYPFASFVFISG